MRALAGFSIALGLLGALVCAGVAITELNYIAGHPYSYGPAKVIAWGAGGAMLGCISAALLGFALLRTAEQQ